MPNRNRSSDCHLWASPNSEAFLFVLPSSPRKIRLQFRNHLGFFPQVTDVFLFTQHFVVEELSKLVQVMFQVKF